MSGMSGIVLLIIRCIVFVLYLVVTGRPSALYLTARLLPYHVTTIVLYVILSSILSNVLSSVLSSILCSILLFYDFYKIIGTFSQVLLICQHQ